MEATIVKNDPKIIRSWVMYDWANSVYILVMTSAVFPAYYNKVTRTDGSDIVDIFGIPFVNTAIYSINMGLAFGLVALISPLLSSISDYTGYHKRFMRIFCYLGAAGCMSLFFFRGVEQIYLGLAGMMLATIGYSGSIVFYNSYLPAIATEDQQDRVSARGFSYGYLGSTLLLTICLALILGRESLGVTDTRLMPRIAFLLVGIWWIGFAQIPFSRLPQNVYSGKHPDGGSYLFNGYQELIKIWRRLGEEKLLKRFLFSFFFYIMGLQTVMFMAASFGEKEVGLSQVQLIITIILLQFVGIAGAHLFAWLSKRIGNLNGLIIAASIWIGICFGSYFIVTPFHFYTAAVFIGMVMGGMQALSRSTYSKVIPLTQNNAGYFSFYDVCEKLAIMCGLVMWGLLDNLTGSMRNSIATLVIWFIISLFGLLWTRRAPNKMNHATE